MKKNPNPNRRGKLLLKKISRIMKLNLFILVITVMQATASVYSQNARLNLKMENATISEVFDAIEKQSDFFFFYNRGQINDQQRVSVDLQNSQIDEVLTTIFGKNVISYEIIDKNIIVKPYDLSDTSSSQQNIKKVTGKVTDSSGGTLPGVSVVVKGTTNGIITDASGNFSLSNISEGTIIQFSFVGMTTQEVVVGSKSEYSIVMSDASIGVDEVIVIGYGTAKRQDYTGSVSSVKMENSPVSNLSNLNALESLKGNVAGLSIGATNSAGGQPTMDIRGQNSISGLNDPLIVLDGVIYLGSLSDINPNDIATYDILKDAVSAAAYGSRSANGVIAITTKKGKTGKPIITFSTSAGVQTWQNQPEMMKGEEWLRLANARSRYAVGTTTWLLGAEKPNQAAGKETVWLR